MEQSSNNTKLKLVIVALGLLLAGSLGYIYKLTTDVTNTIAMVETAKTEKDKVLDDLAILKTKYDEAISENTNTSAELVAEREKVVNLMSEIKKSKGDVAAMSKYKTQLFALQSKMSVLLKENEALKSDNSKLVTQRDSTATILTEARTTNQDLTAKNDDLSKTVDKAAKLKIYNLNIAPYKVKSSGKLVETDKASRVDKLKISFVIAENEVAKTGDKTYNVQVIDSKNNVLGEKKTIEYGENSLTYSFDTTVKYENKSVNVIQDLNGKDFEKGEYYVRVYDKNELVSSSNFVLR